MSISLAQRLAQIFGSIYVLVGALGFVPPLLAGSLPGVLEPFGGFLLGLFAVNWFHSVAHLAIGAAGLATYRSPSAARIYTLVIGAAYAVLFVLGIATASVATLGGLLPLNALDDVLHIATTAIALAAFFASRVPAGQTASSSGS